MLGMELDSEGWRNSKVWCFKIFEIPSLLKTMNQDVSCCCSSLTNHWISLLPIRWLPDVRKTKSTNHLLSVGRWRDRSCKWSSGEWILMSSQAPTPGGGWSSLMSSPACWDGLELILISQTKCSSPDWSRNAQRKESTEYRIQNTESTYNRSFQCLYCNLDVDWAS